MIYPAAPDIWVCEVLFRQSQGLSALRAEAGVGTSRGHGRGETQGKRSLADEDAAVGCRAFPRRFGAPSRCLGCLLAASLQHQLT